MFNKDQKNELFVFFNNELEIYDSMGRVIQRMEFDHNIVCAAQDADTLVVAYENGGICCYDWNKDKIIDELKDIGNVKCLNISVNEKIAKNDKVLVCGSTEGEVFILKRKSK